MASLQYVIKLNEEEEKINSGNYPEAIRELIGKIDKVLEKESDDVL